MDGIGFWMAAVAAAVCVGAGKGGIPIVGMLSVPILALSISPVTAAGLLLPVYVVSDMFGLWAYRKAFDARVLAILLPGAMVGIGLGWAAASTVPENWVRVLVGLIGVSFAANLILRGQKDGPPKRAEVAPGLFWGAVAGFTSFVSHSGGPPYQVYTLPLKMTKTVFAGTSTIAFAVINAAKLLPYWHLGQLTADNLHIALMLMPVAAAAVFAGVWLVKVLPEKLFFRLVIWALLILSVQLLWTGLRA
ncbi:sulfite exporter TauE/SafE family protein [Tabrizicola sp. M-4]|uniref:sulfite exporter TauE/SafE family protein n=1 Tax=Tabrizicola sp. M-4 TaxID=3055847 RepID=UPI003DAA49ED